VQREEMFFRITRTVEKIAQSAGLTATVNILPGIPSTYNNPELVEAMLPALRRAAIKLQETHPIMGAENYSFFSQQIPGFYFLLGTGKLHGQNPNGDIDEKGLVYGVKALSSMVIDYLTKKPQQPIHLQM
jgi:metal-dependent amidase/aminoacylase/carboxypeptidase family protein